MDHIYDLTPGDTIYDVPPPGDLIYDHPPEDDDDYEAIKSWTQETENIYEELSFSPAPGSSGQLKRTPPPSPPDATPPGNPSSSESGAALKRELAVQEIVHTETMFLHHLRLCVDFMLAPLRETQVEGLDVSLVFGNMEEIIGVSQNLLQALHDCTRGGSESHSTLGEVFEKFSPDIEAAYRPYCQYYEEAAACLKCCRGNPATNARIEACEAQLAAQLGMNADLSFMLIKPVQRVMRYSLLLQAVLERTPEGHPERAALRRAVRALLDVNSSINEQKRRTDQVLKYRRQEAMPLVDRLSRLNLHTLQKKGARLSQQFRTATGLSALPADEEFEKVHDSFLALHRLVGALLQGLEGYLLHLQGPQDAWLAAAPGLRVLWPERDVAEPLRAALHAIAERHMQQLRSRLESRVVPLLSGAHHAFAMPQLLVQKRFDKLLDYGRWMENAGSLDDAQQPLELSRREYEALNMQLLEELPTFCRCVAALALGAIQGLVRAHRAFIGAAAAEMEPLREMMNIEAGDPNILPYFLSASARHGDILSRLQFSADAMILLPGSTLPSPAARRDSSTSGSASPASPGPVLPPKLAQYPAEQLHLVTANTTPLKQTDLRLSRGALVAVVTRHDTQGNSHRWLVDSGVSRGFVKSSLLVPYKAAGFSSSSSSSFSSSLSSSFSSMAINLSVPSIFVSGDSPPGDGISKRAPRATPSGGSASRLAHRPSGALDAKRGGLGLAAAPAVTLPTPGEPQPGRPGIADSHNEMLQPGDDRPRSASVYMERGYGWAVPEDGSGDDGGGDGGWGGTGGGTATMDGGAEHSPAGQASGRKHVAQGRRWTMGPRAESEGGQQPSGAVPTASPLPSDGQEWCALFKFSAQGVGQASVLAGQRVRVLHTSDLAGNPQWWLVESDGGHRGYVPASFLGTMQR
ncbi:LOW QUALITY PROTEIN: rho guanine nucleotide exchange factor 37-like [Lethenteron reissneri]|uniref:LOW QUALITY PROTEIN: rho guanine nucleotide exchange factor 37-like n=1 Tax=Lethenteron reissneri TaxID=7753 RepID=UPI002AB7BBFE|nr:LOW QUALITY PROTEIN: rho guanine nucleotide exchange factor 37-like [Lethenteron reissneri]